MKRLKILLWLVLAVSCTKRKEIYRANEGAPGSKLTVQVGGSSLVGLQKRMEKGDITSTEVVEALNVAQTPEEQRALQQGIQKGIEWFSKKAVETLTPADLQEYSSLAHIQIQTDRSANRQLLLSYFGSLCNKIDEKYQHGEEPLIQALEYTLQTMDSDVFEGNLEPLIQLGNKLLAKLDPTGTVFSKETYPTHRSMLYALHQTLVLIQHIAPSKWDEGIYNRFKKQVEAIAHKAQYYPFRYHALLLDEILERLKSEEYRARLKRMRIVSGLRAGLAMGQVVVALAAGKLDTDALQKIYTSLQAAFAREGIEGQSWYDRYQDIVQCIHALEDIRGEIKDFLGECQSLKAAFASEGMEEKTCASERMEERTWYAWHQVLKYASILSLGNASEYSVFEQGLKALQKSKLKNETKEGCTALRFGIVQQLRLLSLEGPAEVRKKSIQWLEDLANPEAWGGDPEVMEELLDGLACIAKYSQGGS